MDRDGGNKEQRLYIYGSNYALSKPAVYNRLKINREWRTQILLSSSTAIDPLAQNPGWRGSILIQKLIKILILVTNILTYVTDHYNAISFDRLSSKTKIGKD